MAPYYEQDGITIYHGDSLDVVPMLEPESISAVITDPPYGLGFMGKAWDHAVPGVPFWQAFSAAMKPGAHLAAFGGSRTYHRMGVAIEDAGLELRDTLMWLYGQGFPKSHDVSKAIDKAAGAEREVVGTAAEFARDGAKRSATNHGDTRNVTGFAGDTAHGWDRPITAPATPDAAQWAGWGTALKPAHEPIILARKPLSGTVAANVLAHGCGALNIDASRISGEPWKAHDATGLASTKFFTDGDAKVIHKEPHTAGRWPANVILDEDAAAALDRQSGVSSSAKGKQKYKRAETTSWIERGGSFTPGREWEADGYGDTGGASRFFKTVAQDQECLTCSRTYEPKHDIMNVTEGVTGCDHASSAETSSPQSDPMHGSAHGPVPVRQPLESEASSRSSDGPASTAGKSSASTPQTRTPIAADDALGSLTESLVPRVRSAASLCDSCVTAIAQSLAAMLLGQTPASRHGLDCMPNSSASILTRNLASYVEPMVNTGIIPTTASLSTLFGSVAHAIDASTSKASGAPSTAYGPMRFLYQSKASRAERNAGLDGMPERGDDDHDMMVSKWVNDSRHPDGGYPNKPAPPKANHHPTVKPLALMRYLVTLIAPPGGIVLDPFAGSGTTGVVCAELGIPCVLIEKSEDYLPIIVARIRYAQEQRAQLANQYPLGV